MLHVTHRCDLACQHCFQTEETHPHEQMSREQIAHLLDELAAAGVLFLTLTGGEPFLRRDLLDIVADARARRFAVIIKTAGHHITAEKAQRLKQLGVHEVQISLYSHDPAVSDSFTQRRGSWQRTVNGLRLLRQAGVRTNVRAALTSFNHDHVRELKALAESLGAEMQFGAGVDIRTNGDRSGLRFNVTAEQRARAAEEMGATPENVMNNAEAICAGDGFSMSDRHLCSAARDLVSISATGEVHPCMLHPRSGGNALSQGFRKVWEESSLLNDVRRITYGEMARTGCAGCGYQSSCKPCMALAASENGDSRSCNTSSHLNAQATLLLARARLPTPPGGWPEPAPPPHLRNGRGLLRVLS
ncbi:MAG: radical SAM protein [Myxococcota bacterium]